MAFIKGKDCTLTIGAEIINVRDVTISLTAETMSTETRASAGWTEPLQGTKTGELTCDIVVDQTDTSMTTLRTAYLAGTEVDITSVEDTATWTSSGYITEFSTSEPLNDFVTVSVKIATAAWTCA